MNKHLKTIVETRDWWLSVLLSLLPPQLKNILLREDTLARVYCCGEKFDVISADSEKNVSIDLDGQSILDNEIADALLAEMADYGNIELVVYGQQVLETRFELPLELKPDINNHLVYEMNRYTPFDVGDIYYRYEIENSDRENSINVRLYCVKNSVVNAIADLVGRSGCLLRKICLSTDDNIKDLHSTAGLSAENYSSKKYSDSSKQQHRLLTFSLILIPVLVAINLLLPLLLDVYALSAGNSILDEKQQTYREILRKNHSIHQQFQDDVSFINLRSQNTNVASLVDRLSQLIPEDTYLSKIELLNNEVTIHGESDDVYDLMKNLSHEKEFSQLKLLSEVRINQSSKKEKFSMLLKSEQ